MVKAEQQKQYLLIQLGHEWYGIDLRYVDSVIRMKKIVRIPKAQKYFKGIITLCGRIVEVMSVRQRLGLPDDIAGESSRIVVLNIGGRGLVGMIADKTAGIAGSETGNAAEFDTRPFISGALKYNEDLIYLFDIPMLFGEG